jgi:metacaspase-1
MEKRALCIGINNYPGTANDLNGCINDANDWKNERQKRGFKVEVLLDDKAKKVDMIAALEKLIAPLKKGDLAVFTYSGHGTWVPDKDDDESDQRDEALCPYDIMSKQFLTDDEMYEIFKKRKRGSKIIFISDSCHSGTVARVLEPMDAEPLPTAKPRFLDPSVFLSEAELSTTRRGVIMERGLTKKKPNTALLMSGCQEKEYSYDARINNRPNGAFTYNALKILKDLPTDASFQDWHKAIRKSLPTNQYPQTPNFEASATQKKWKIFE